MSDTDAQVLSYATRVPSARRLRFAPVIVGVGVGVLGVMTYEVARLPWRQWVGLPGLGLVVGVDCATIASERAFLSAVVGNATTAITLMGVTIALAIVRGYFSKTLSAMAAETMAVAGISALLNFPGLVSALLVSRVGHWRDIRLAMREGKET